MIVEKYKPQIMQGPGKCIILIVEFWLIFKGYLNTSIPVKLSCPLFFIYFLMQ